MVTILISAGFRGAALVKGRHLFKCGYPKVRRLFEAQCLLEEIWYMKNPLKQTGNWFLIIVLWEGVTQQFAKFIVLNFHATVAHQRRISQGKLISD